MGSLFMALAAMLLLALAVVAYGVVASQKSVLLALISLAVAILAAGGAGYAWAESHSILWTGGYSLVAITSLVAALRQFVGGTRSDRQLVENDER